MKIFKHMFILLISITLYASNATASDCSLPTAENVVNAEVWNTSGAVDIADLIAYSEEGCPIVDCYHIKSIPSPDQGVLYMADGVSTVTPDQELTPEQARGLKFNPKEGFTGEATFTFVAKDSDCRASNVATFTIPVVEGEGGGSGTIPTADAKVYNDTIDNTLGATDIPDLSGTDAQGNPVTKFRIVTLPSADAGILYLADGTAVVAGDELTKEQAEGLKFDPKEGYVGDAIFTYSAIDDNGLESDEAPVTIPVGNPEGGNGNKPTAENKTNPTSISNQEGATDIVDLSGTDAQGNPVSKFKIVTLPSADAGILYLADGTVVTANQPLTKEQAEGLKFDPKAGYVGDATFTYVAIDDNGLESDVATVTIPVSNGTKPTADDKTHTATMSNLWGPTDILDLSGKDAEGNPVSEFQITSLPTADQGVLYMADGTTAVILGQVLTKDEADGLKFDPKEGFIGDATFTYVAIDGNGIKSDDATVTIPVGSTGGVHGNKPTADNITHPTAMSNLFGPTKILPLSGKDSDGNTVNEFQITSLPTADQGVLYMADGTTAVILGQVLTKEEAANLKFDPKEGYVGNATFTYVAIDDNGLKSNDATVTIPVSGSGGSGGNGVKPITDDRLNPKMLNTLGATDITNLSGTDKDGHAVTKFVITELPDANQGVLYMADGTTPVTLNQELTLEEANGLKFDPKDGFVGDATFKYAAIDKDGVVGNSATVTIPVGDTITANDKKPTTDSKKSRRLDNTMGAVDIVNLTGTDKDGHEVPKFVITKLPAANEGVLYMADGTTPVTLNQVLTHEEANGLKFDPKAGFVGDATFRYASIDKDGVRGDEATVTIPVGDPAGGTGGHGVKPITDDRLNPKMLNTLGATDITNLSGTDKDGHAVTKFVITELPDANQGVLYMADGTTPVTVNQELTLEEADGLKFDPKAGFVGDATFKYAAIDKDGVRGNIATVTIPVGNTVSTDDKKPTADSKTSRRLDNTMGAVDIVNLTGTDKDGNPVTKFVITKLPAANEGVLYMADGKTPVTLNQELTLEEANGLKFDPKDGFVGNATFRYASIDNDGVRGEEATVTIPVGDPANGSVVANDDTGRANDNANPIHINVLANDTGVPTGAVVRLVDANGAYTNRVVVQGEGVWSVNANNMVTFTPKSPFVGTPTPIQYVVQNSDGEVISNRATIRITGVCVCEPYESSVDALSTFGLLVMLLLSSLLGARVLGREFN